MDGLERDPPFKFVGRNKRVVYIPNYKEADSGSYYCSPSHHEYPFFNMAIHIPPTQRKL